MNFIIKRSLEPMFTIRAINYAQRSRLSYLDLKLGIPELQGVLNFLNTAPTINFHYLF